ncbi:MAG TPA: TetR/AcrR family transcriptional regulator [Facklamia tabacinasalis]|nr:TetR/AcrR family transcriptional regulator [Ruoffia tabacinasalis]
MQSAITEFGLHRYSETSLNAISKESNFSKGIIYHYFKNKHDLYLACVAECFESFITFLNEESVSFENIEVATKIYFSLRQQFFDRKSEFSNIFTNAVFHPPLHLKKEIRALKTKLDQFNYDFYESIHQTVDLKDLCDF